MKSVPGELPRAATYQSVQVSRRFSYLDASDSSLGVIERFTLGQPDHELTSFALTSTVRLKLSAVELDETPGNAETKT